MPEFYERSEKFKAQAHDEIERRCCALQADEALDRHDVVTIVLVLLAAFGTIAAFCV